MTTATRTKKRYRFKQLKRAAREHALEEHQATYELLWGEEAMESLRKLAEHFRGKLIDWNIDWSSYYYSSASFDMPDVYENYPTADPLNLLGDGATFENEEVGGWWDGISTDELARLIAALGSYDPETLRGHGDCVLTGCCWDESAIDGLRWEYLRNGTTDLKELMAAAFKSWMKCCVDNYEYETSAEYLAEHDEEYDWRGDLVD